MTTPVSPLVADLVTASLAMTHDTTDALITSLTADADHAWATVDAIRDAVSELTYGSGRMPPGVAVHAALHPSEGTIAAYKAQRKCGAW